MKGKLLTCTRCSTAIFLKQIDVTTLDGGYTKVVNFEKLPKSWMYATEFGYLCPDCAKLFQENMTYFLGHDRFAPVFKVEEDPAWKPHQMTVYMKEEAESV